LYLKEDVNEDGSLKPGTIAAQQKDSRVRLADGGDDEDDDDDAQKTVDEDKAIEDARQKLSKVDIKDGKTSSEDLD
jgi:hypothetical protein